jgi:Putative 2OG-Fe(II) oxygenase
MKFAYINPTVLAVDNVPAEVFSHLKGMTDAAHQLSQFNDAGDPAISVRGGQQIQLLPNSFGLDITVLKNFVEQRCYDYMDAVTRQSGKSELTQYTPELVSAWTIKQSPGDYQALHTHDAHLSGNIYIDVPDLDPSSQASDANIEFRFPTIKEVSNFIFIDQLRFAPQPMMMLIFPSYIPHTVYPWRGQGNRTILAWDVKLTAKTS